MTEPRLMPAPAFIRQYFDHRAPISLRQLRALVQAGAVKGLELGGKLYIDAAAFESALNQYVTEREKRDFGAKRASARPQLNPHNPLLDRLRTP